MAKRIIDPAMKVAFLKEVVDRIFNKKESNKDLIKDLINKYNLGKSTVYRYCSLSKADLLHEISRIENSIERKSNFISKNVRHRRHRKPLSDQEKFHIFKIFNYVYKCKEKNIKYTIYDIISHATDFYNYQTVRQILNEDGRFKNASKIASEVSRNPSKYIEDYIFEKPKSSEKVEKVEKVFEIKFASSYELSEIIVHLNELGVKIEEIKISQK